MRNRFMLSVAALLVLVSCSCVTFAQTYGTKGYSPGAWKPDELPKGLSNPKPFDPHNLSGVWSMPTKQGYFERHSLNDKAIKDSSECPSADGVGGLSSSYDAVGKGEVRRCISQLWPAIRAAGEGNDPVSTCEPLGYPRDLWEANLRPFEFIQAPDRVLQHMQYHDLWRTIWTDGRQLPKNPDPAWNGYSVGRWEGDTFVVESNGYDDRTWLDHFGNPHSDQMHLVERYKRVNIDTLELDMTLTDPKTYTAPWVGDKITFVQMKWQF